MKTESLTILAREHDATRSPRTIEMEWSLLLLLWVANMALFFYHAVSSGWF